ncbi:MAG: four helix bundle protein [Patescibacteria group bacterium]
MGVKIDALFLEIAEEIFSTAYAGDKGKMKIILKASNKLDRLKLLLKIGWEVKMLDDKKYIAISIPLSEIGKMIGGWKKQLTK